MKKVFSLFICAYLLVGCSATHQAKVRDRINNDKKTSKISNKTTSSEVLNATSNVRVTSDAIVEYIDAYKDAAMESMVIYGIPASVKLAQGILESGSGKAKLAITANNHFGIKCQNVWSGAVVYHTDDAPNECFRKYNSALESFNDHSLFLTSRAHYQNLFTLNKNDYKSWANGLKKAGYATDPNYAKKLISLIERYELYTYDEMVLSNQFQSKGKKYVANENRPSYHEVTAGETLYRISNKYNISVEDIQRLNNLSGTTISVGQLLKLK